MTDLRGADTPAKLDMGSTGKIVGAIIVLAVICGFGAYSYESGMWNSPPKPVVANNQLPQTTPPTFAR